MVMKVVKAAIVGAGIGGCSLLLAFRHLNHQLKDKGLCFAATVYEQAPSLQPLGAGVALSANSLGILESLGLYHKLEAIGEEATSLCMYTHKGHKLNEWSYAYQRKQYGYPTMFLERAELQKMLVEAVEEENEGGSIAFNKTCARVESSPSGPRLLFADGSVESADVVIGADGLKSVVRHSLLEQLSSQASVDRGRGLPTYSGLSCTLGLTAGVPELGLPPGGAAQMFGPGAVYGSWSLTGGRQYWYLLERQAITPEGADIWAPASAAEAMDRMWNWFFPYDAHAMFSNTVRTARVGLFESPVPTAASAAPWARGRVALIGDAGHTALPTLWQGANLAIEDACSLAKALAFRGDVPEALQAYASGRQERVRQVMRVSGILAELQTSESTLVRGVNVAVHRMASQKRFEKSLHWLYGYMDRLS